MIDWQTFEDYGYRRTDDTATAKTAAEPRWALCEFWINGEREQVYSALTEPTTLADAHRANLRS